MVGKKKNRKRKEVIGRGNVKKGKRKDGKQGNEKWVWKTGKNGTMITRIGIKKNGMNE